MGRVNLVQLRREIAAQEATIIFPRMKEVLNQKFIEEKKGLMAEFDSHPVTRELNAGPDASSNIIQTTKGGNLYSLLGFVDKVKPAQELRNALENGITKGRVTKTQKTKNVLGYNLEVRMPTLEELRRKTELLTWTTRSFIDLIEKGVGNFSRYLFDKSGRLRKYSRSGTAIQVKDRKMRDDEFNGVEYVTAMIKKFQRALKGFNK